MEWWEIVLTVAAVGVLLVGLVALAATIIMALWAIPEIRDELRKMNSKK